MVTITVNPGESIQSALDSLPVDGGIIQLADGIHTITSNILISKNNVTVTGSSNAIISGGYSFLMDSRNNANNFINNTVLNGYTSQSGFFISAYGVSNLTVNGITNGNFIARSPANNGCDYFNDHITISNCRNLGYVGFLCTNYIDIYNNTVTNSIDMNQGNGFFEIHDNPHIEDVSYNWGIRLHGNPHHFRIYNNTIYTGITGGNNASIYIDGGHGGFLDAYFEIYNNTLLGQLSTRYAGIVIRLQQFIDNLKIYNNIIKNVQYGIVFDEFPYGYSGASSTTTVINNVIINTKKGIYYLATTQGGRATIKNNIIMNSSEYGIDYSSYNPLYPSDWSYNDIYNSGISNYYNTTPGTGDISVDPLFVDIINNDFHLKSQGGRWNPNTLTWVNDTVTSPCLNRGDPTLSNTLSLWGGRIEIGRYGNTIEASNNQTCPILICNMNITQS